MQNQINTNLSGIAQIILGGTPSRANQEYWNGDIKWIAIEDIKNAKGRYITDTTECITEEGVKHSNTKVLEKDTILISSRGTVGELALLSEDMAFNQSIYGLISKDQNKVDQLFLYYLLKNEIYKYKRIAHGGVFDTFTMGTFERFHLVIPKDITTQKRVALALSFFDELIENNRQRIEILEEMAQLLYREWFVEFRFPGYEKCKFVDSELGKIPEGWKVTEIYQLLEIRSGYPFKSSTYIDSGKYKIVTISNVGDSKFNPQTNDRVGLIPNGMPNYCELTDGDILISLTGNIGRICMVYGEDNFLLNQRVGKVEVKSFVYKSYVYCLFSSYYLRKYLENISNGAAQQNLSPIETVKIKICIPKKAVLENFHLALNPMLEQIIVLNNQNIVLATNRDLLLPRLMSGGIKI